ncbi:MAG: putative ABC exporter domain-containing protein [Isosphaeraceae bacterium]
MDSSLLLLLRLRTGAWLRRWGRNVRTLKGSLQALVGTLFFVPMVLAFVLAPRIQTEAQTELIRRYGALGLFAFCVLNVVMSTGERAVYYSPGEVNFLFSGPYRPRQLLLYKIVSGLGMGLLTTPFMTLAFAHHARSFFAAFVGLYLALQFLAMFTIGVSLLVSTLGAHAFSIGRKLVLAGTFALVVGALYPVLKQTAAGELSEVIESAVKSPVLGVVLLPFEPFVRTFTARAVWPDLTLWALAAAGVDVLLLGGILALNAHFLEASANASARLYERVKRAKRGDAWSGGGTRALVSVPMFPWLGGAGPNYWRQITTATRQIPRLVGVFSLFMIPTLVTMSLRRPVTADASSSSTIVSLVVGLAVFAPAMIGFDFRPDLVRMEMLKTLPIRPGWLAVGQLAASATVLTLIEWVTLGVLAAWIKPDPAFVWGAAVLVPPVNLMMIAVENVYFLWFPFRMVGLNSLDFQAMGRQLLLVAGKFMSAGVAVGLSAAAGAGAYYVTGGWAFALLSSWLVLSACALALVPLVALAFEQFDVAQIPAE